MSENSISRNYSKYIYFFKYIVLLFHNIIKNILIAESWLSKDVKIKFNMQYFRNQLHFIYQFFCVNY